MSYNSNKIVSDKTGSIHLREDKDLLVFLHIEKTAGTTLTEFFRSIFSHKSGKENKKVTWIAENAFHEKRNEDINYFNDTKILCGHFNYGIHRHLPHKKAHYFCVVREPLQRVFSWYKYQKVAKYDPGHSVASKLDFNDWIITHIKNKSNLIRNFQSGRILGKHTSNNVYQLENLYDHLLNNFSILITSDFVDRFIKRNLHLVPKSQKIERKKVSKNEEMILEKNIEKEFYDLNRTDLELFNFIKKNQIYSDLSIKLRKRRNILSLTPWKKYSL